MSFSRSCNICIDRLVDKAAMKKQRSGSGGSGFDKSLKGIRAKWVYMYACGAILFFACSKEKYAKEKAPV